MVNKGQNCVQYAPDFTVHLMYTMQANFRYLKRKLKFTCIIHTCTFTAPVSVLPVHCNKIIIAQLLQSLLSYSLVMTAHGRSLLVEGVRQLLWI